MFRSRFSQIFFHLCFVAGLLAATLTLAVLGVRYATGGLHPWAMEEVYRELAQWFLFITIDGTFVAAWTVTFFPRRYFPVTIAVSASLYAAVTLPLTGHPFLFASHATIFDLASLMVLAYLILYISAMWDDDGIVPDCFNKE